MVSVWYPGSYINHIFVSKVSIKLYVLDFVALSLSLSLWFSVWDVLADENVYFVFTHLQIELQCEMFDWNL